MTDSFDPYHKWLGIPPKDQPPNHYRLLGVELLEADGEVIEAAADRQMAHLRTYQIGKHATLSQQILNEISAAKIVLLTAEKKRAYDEALRKSQAPMQQPRRSLPVATAVVPTPAVAVRVAPAPVQQSAPDYTDPLLEAPLNFAESAGATPSRARQRTATNTAWQKPAIGAGVVVAVLGLLVLVFLRGESDESTPTQGSLAKAEPQAPKPDTLASDRRTEPPPARAVPEVQAPDPTPAEVTVDDSSPGRESGGGSVDAPDPPAVAETEHPSSGAPNSPDEPSVDLSIAEGDKTEASPSAGQVLVCERLAAKAGPAALVEGGQAFDGPNGDGRHGAKGLLLQAPADWQKTGTVWTFEYQRDGSPYGLQIVHPFKQGHVLISVWHDVAIVTSGFWDDFGWGDPASTLPIGKSPNLATMLPIQKGPTQVKSSLDVKGNYTLELNGQVVARAKVDIVQPLNLGIRPGRHPRAVQGYGNPEFAGAGLPRTLGSGEAGLLLGPLDNGVHAAANVRLAGAAPSPTTATPGEEPAVGTAGEFRVPAKVGRASISNDGTVVLLNCEGGARLFEIASHRELGQTRGNATGAGFLPDGKTPFTAPWEGAFALWNPQTGDKAGDGIGGFQVKSVAFSADGRLAAVGGLRGVVTISDLAKGGQKAITAFDRDHSIEGMAFSPDARRVLAVSPNGLAKWMDVVAGNEAGSVETPISILLAALPDGRIVSAAPNGGSDIEVRDSSSGRIIARWQGHTARISDLAVSHSGDFVTVAADNTARLWNTTSGKSIVLWQNDTELQAVAFSADGKNLVIASGDGHLRYWLGWSARDAQSGKLAGPDKSKPRLGGAHGTKLTLDEVQELFGVNAAGWHCEGESLLGTVGDVNATTKKAGYSVPAPVSSVTFEFKMQAKWVQVISIDIDGKLYQYRRGDWSNEGAKVIAAGQELPRLKGTVAAPDKWCRLRAELKANKLRFFYDGAPVWSGVIPKTATAKHSVRVGFDSHETTVSVKDFVLELK